MENGEIIEGLHQLPPPTSLTVIIAVSGNERKGKYTVNWALEKLVPEGMLLFKLLHVRPKITGIPTQMGNIIPLTGVREDVVIAFKKEVEWQTNGKLLPYKKMCAQRKVQAEIVQIESDDVVNAIAEEIAKSSIKKLVIGASSRGLFSRGQNMTSKISKFTPSFCTVYAVSKGKLLSLRPSDSETAGSFKDDSSETSVATNSSTPTSSSQTESTDPSSTSSYCHIRSPLLPMQRFEALAMINQTLLRARNDSQGTIEFTCHSPDSWEGGRTAGPNNPSSSEISDANSAVSSSRSLVTDKSWISELGYTSDAATHFSSESQADVNFEIEKLRIELKHRRGMYALVQTETLDASRKLNDLQKRRQEEAIKLKEISLKEEEAKELAQLEKTKFKAAKREAKYVKERAEREAAQRKQAENKAVSEAKEKEKLENAINGNVQRYQNFSWEEVVSATSSFSEDLKIGMGANGTVFKASFHQTVAAVKVLHSQEVQRTKQFHQELEILSRIRHPHLLILLGACLDHGCLVYEYMENGSLEERLFRKENTPPIPWFDRYRIVWEVALALNFLHNSNIIHRDLKPANILLDRNLVSKIGDVGLSTMLQSDTSHVSTMYKETSPVGTLCYIDPEYQRSGSISVKSDVYALGLIIMQLLTAKPPMALANAVETAVEEGRIMEVVDKEAGEWPAEETKELAFLGLRCAELRRRDRPDLKDEILPILERLKEVADRARGIAAEGQSAPPPNHFLCPLLKDVMELPCVAADGYTYDHKAISEWFEGSDKSPMTNLPVPNKILLPNYTLLAAILDWKSGKL